jgi:hypothetical protein
LSDDVCQKLENLAEGYKSAAAQEGCTYTQDQALIIVLSLAIEAMHDAIVTKGTERVRELGIDPNLHVN